MHRHVPRTHPPKLPEVHMQTTATSSLRNCTVARNISTTMLQCRLAAIPDQGRPQCAPLFIVGAQSYQLYSPQSTRKIACRYPTEVQLPLRSLRDSSSFRCRGAFFDRVYVQRSVGGFTRSFLRGGSVRVLRDSSLRRGSRLQARAGEGKVMAFTGEMMSVELKHAGYEGPAVSIPKLGLGVYQASPRETVQAVTYALRNGYRHIDTAHLYGNEQAVGKAVRDSQIPREEVFVTTKLWNSDHGYQNTLKAFNQSLKELNLGYVDLYLVHSPMAAGKRLDTWRAMEEILKSGKAKAIGVSNYGVHHLKELFAHCTIRPSVNQVELTPFCSREKLVKFCEAENIVLESYSPLTKGYRLNDKTLVEIGKEYKKTPAQVLIRWCLQKNFVVLPKSVTPHRIVENSQVFDFNIADKHMAKLDSLEEDWGASWDPTKGP